MIIGGVVFGYFAGLTYWFPKIFGFRLNEKWGVYAFWCWLIGFLLAFMPLYILGLMGATRRLDHYEASTGWQGLFVVSAIGLCIILLGVGFQILQLGMSLKDRAKNRDKTGDPWKGRTLEWATASPPVGYNFATLPIITGRDAFWELKKSKAPDKIKYSPISVSKNTPLALFIAISAFLASFGLVWHIFWLALLSLLAILACLVIRSTNEHTEKVLSVKDIEIIEGLTPARRKYL